MRRLAYLSLLLIGSCVARPALAADPDGTIAVAPGATWRIEVGPNGFVVTAGGGSVAMPAGSTWRIDGTPGQGWTIGLSLPAAPANPAPAPAPATEPGPPPQGPPGPPPPSQGLIGRMATGEQGHVRVRGRIPSRPE